LVYHESTAAKVDEGDAMMIESLIEMTESIKNDPFLSLTTYTEHMDDNLVPSQFMDFVEQTLTSAFSDQVMQKRGSECCPHANFSTEVSLLDKEELLQIDHYGNNALHHAAGAHNFDAILMLLSAGMEAEALNNFGQTFLHLLDVHDEIEQYIEVIHLLVRRGTNAFPFLHKDNSGLTIFHRFLMSTAQTKNISSEIMIELHSLLGFQYHKVNKGCHEVVDVELDFEARLSSLPLEEWASGDADITNELDKHGNTCLIAILKVWPEHRSEQSTLLIQLIDQLTITRDNGVNINAYDREGNTALAIAARRGLHSATERLLALGANPNATNYHETSILKETQVQRKAVLESNDYNLTLYIGYLRCERLLEQYGAKRDVNPFVEFTGGRVEDTTVGQRDPVTYWRRRNYYGTPGLSPTGKYRRVWVEI
jgi:ankyrin repeat protein